ncbi:MAG: recombinase family protein [Anaerolineae bacterium]|nr:recombinase family protein [Anaerolineae bacterium]
MRAAIYARVSTDEQHPENQIAELRAWCAEHGHAVVAEYVEQESGAKAERAQFRRMMADAARRRFELLVFWSLDRLSREGVAQTIQHLARLEHYGVKFRAVRQPELDTTAPWGWVIVALMAALADIERQLIRERTRAGLARARALGKRIGRPPLSADTLRIAQAAAEGKSQREIALLAGVSPSTVRRRLAQLRTTSNATSPTPKATSGPHSSERALVR